ncbi:translesion DNA synthesis-associated protein ImuA [Herbaspirillum rubrisubalbicans]|uniref:Cell division protein n=1 Tax=Herbaspirillum rubrisubalbicans Os34 TaxID=1235827 RepID=A0A6M3ZX89_9BURK|nr:translesion DNA synthesis-associated protein ImuA [Herbaspirillum rubrisubalbicans]QJQ03305.1 cell division protein [Herbaspirillum rubrisubalbicans Os34]
MTMLRPSPQSIHHSLWRASQLAQGGARGIDTGFAELSQELPGRGWPTGALIDFLLQQPGVGELRLLGPALQSLAPRRIALVQTPHAPHLIGWQQIGVEAARLLAVRTTTSADAAWAAEQILKSDSCAALLLWQRHLRPESVRRLHLAAQSGQTLFVMLRPGSCAQDASPAPLRLALTAAPGGIAIDFIKRRGPLRAAPLFVSLPSLNLLPHAPVDRRTPAFAAAGGVLSELAG